MVARWVIRLGLACLAALAAGAAWGETVHMAFGDNLPPYILPSLDSGIEVDIVREALAFRGHVLQAHYLPMGRIPFEFIAGRVDAIMMDVGENMSAHGGVYGVPPVLYDNVFFTLTRRKLGIHVPEDLKPLTVVSFVGASKRYPEWLGPLDHSRNYVERNNQATQPLLLALGRYDVVLSDRTIFQYYMHEQARKDPAFRVPEVSEHAFTTADPRDYRPVFRSRTIRDDFNAGLEHLRKTGRYRAIYQKYLNS